VRTTTPEAEYLPPVSTPGYNYEPPANPLNPGANQFDVVILVPTTASPIRSTRPVATTPRPVTAGVTTPRPTRPTGASVVQTTEHEEHHHHDVPFWDFRESIPGDPETDYPIYDKIPETAFTCNDRIDGYYADLETRCQVFHVCSLMPNGQAIQNSFLCPNGTLFNQEIFTCQWWADVECATSDQFYDLNKNIGVVPEANANQQATNNRNTVVAASGVSASAGVFTSGSQGVSASAGVAISSG